mmetsp:Transcript_3620/g.6301  ORF Transcript_3620/g.6301 Transcript_3620/m.6301 type:complete len:191 (-) Transcript_3620:576-1148(-)|eukprot:CAMPEP_0197726522 /NCGR_PEP_ID=MMETSP1434-20131217/16135_1 /TAXON_ID=265543 /ORGANISM="Minutocellus polymorphus, Strain CCMP3303" /LENGTH=190 /DNA_ID=CAMNT_0043312483 /DNA_START=160 /DNA_END=732 /DNA_ORIENTATION=+
MLSEVVNALFVTYLATEIQLTDPNTDRVQAVLQSKLTQALTIVVVVVNFSVRLHIHVSGSVFLSAANSAVSFASHAPKVLFAAVAYVVALYFDCKRSKKDLAVGDFLKSVGTQFCRIALVYPFLAVMISFVFLFIISAFEALHLPEEVLNMPIYYGTLYGPFSWIYYMVKKRIVEISSSLPSTMTAYYAR